MKKAIFRLSYVRKHLFLVLTRHNILSISVCAGNAAGLEREADSLTS